MTSRATNRRGLTLMEVILSIAILGGALATIGELIRLGARNAAMSRDLTTAQLYAESKMSEVAAGVVDLSSLETEPLDEAGEWTCTITPDELDQQQLIAVTIVVGQNPDQFSRPVSYSLTRWIIDPAYVAECAALDADLKARAKQAVSNAGQSAGGTSSAGAAGGQPGSGGQQGGGSGQGDSQAGQAGGGFPGGGVPGGGGPGAGGPDRGGEPARGGQGVPGEQGEPGGRPKGGRRGR